ncbi:MAG: PIG-L family deacetylase [Cytophagaceae bacterium]|nr:PIG-L family deacetylase [Cytophagaceae bacterium]
MKKILLTLTLFYLPVCLFAQNQTLSSSEILQGIKKLNTVGNAMYIAAHPDDEDTLLISWLANEKKVRTAYMALTRGDGGQNLIGAEQGEYVGLLRTHELLEARKIDGGEQYFSRAIDFGFSKKTEEALSIWGKEQILEDMVYQIRKFKPDVLINRFPPDERAGHGHHSASAVLAAEAFDAAADPKIFPDQVKTFGIWQVKRLVWNSFNRGFTNAAPNEPSFFKVSLGDYNPLLGVSYPELAAKARSKHRSQGFGSAPSRGERFDFMVNVKGEPAKEDLFENIDLSWNRVENGESIGKLLNEIIALFDIQNPGKSTEKLIDVYRKIESLPENPYKQNKLEECMKLIMGTAGLYFEANPTTNTVAPGESLKILTTATNRSSQEVILQKISIKGIAAADSVINQKLSFNKNSEAQLIVKIPANAENTQPYWLQTPSKKGIYQLKNPEFRGLPMAPAPLFASFEFSINGKNLEFSHPLKYKYTEPSLGEIYKYLEIRPEINLNLDQKVYIFSDEKPKKVSVKAFSNKINAKAKVSLEAGKGWVVNPKEIEVNFPEKNQEKQLDFFVTPPKNASQTTISVSAKTENGVISNSIKTIKYDHIPELNIFPEAKSIAQKINISKTGNKIGYVAGAGDEVPDALHQIGYEVSMLDQNTIGGNLADFDAIIIGVRAYNTENWLPGMQNTLFEYVKNGGNMIVQYQTQAFYGTVKTKELGPYPINIGRGRVTDEDAEMKILDPTNKILNTPNKITTKDFEGWVQERGLYFADKWSDQYKSIFSIKDQGETEQEGSLLIAKYGKGNYIFTGLSFFRQLPAGVPGAYRLMANLISLEKN